jgi:hypothetical protein
VVGVRVGVRRCWPAERATCGHAYPDDDDDVRKRFCKPAADQHFGARWELWVYTFYRRLMVSENAVHPGVWHAVGPTKGRQARSVPVPEFVLDELSLQCKGKAPGDLVCGGREGGYLQRPKSSTGWFQAAVRRAKIQKVTPHDLRHTCASLAVSAGVNVLALQRMLGHKSAKITLDTYADLFDDDLDAVSVSLHARYSLQGNCDSPKLLASCGQNAATGRPKD